jgi:hypothetical protein
MAKAEQVVRAVQALAEIIEETAREAGPMGAPSGVVYMALNGAGVSLETYQAVLGALQRAGRVTVSGDLIRAVA